MWETADMAKRWRWVLAFTIVLTVLGLVGRRGRLVERITGTPRTARGYVNSGINALRQREPGAAIRAFQRAVALEPEDAEIHYLLAQALETAGRTDEAAREYRTTVTLNPSLVSPRYNLAVIYRLQGNYTSMEAELQQAVTRFPDFGAAHRLLGTLYFDRGEWEGALSELTRALKDPSAVIVDRVSVHLMLGRSAEKLGRDREAAEHWRTVLVLDPNNREAQQELKALSVR